MSTLDKILRLLKEQNKKQIELTNYLGISKNVFTSWKSGKNTSYTKHIGKVAEFFDVSADYLLGKTDTRKSLSDSGEVKENINIIKIVGRDGSYEERALTDDQLELFKKMIDALPEATDL